MLCKFEPKSIFDMSLVTAALRPSGATYRDELIKKHFHNNPSPIIDEMLKDNYGYLCLEENQRICTPNGFTCIKDIKEGDVVYTSKKPSKVTNKYNNGIQKIYKVKTKCGIIACTKNHKLLTQEGYIPLEKIMQDVDRYCIGHKINEYGSVIHDSNKMKILGWLLGDGCTTQTRGKSINKVMFTHAIFEDCLDFKKAIENAFPDLTVSIKNIKSRVNKTDLYRCNVLGIRRTNGRCGLNSLCSYLKDMNMYDKDALHKTIPNELYSAHKISLLYFIGAYTDTDGYIKKQPNAIQYKTVSKELALGIQEILRHLGFIATIYENKNKEHVSYAIVVNSACNFLRTVYPYSNKVRRLFENIEDIKNKRNLDTGEFPVKYIQKVLDKNSISLKKVQTKLNNTLYDKKYITEGTVKKISKFFNIKIDAFDENIKYYRILSIEEDSISQVYDISVADVHDFVLEGGIVTHNCYQEDIIKFLQEVCGLSGSDADNVRRGIARKKPEVLEKAMPAIMEGYCNKSEHSREEAEKEAREFLQIIEDASSYMFGYNHSVAYCLIGYLCAYLRYYHPADFITSYLNNADNEDDIVAGYELAKVYKVNIYPPRFRYSIDKYVLDKDTGNIYKGISSIKFLNSGAATFLYSLRNNEYKDFVDVLVDISQSNEVNTRQLEILIRLQFFQEFGNNGKLLKIYNMFKAVYGRKQLNKSKLNDIQINMDMLSKYVKVETDKMLKDIDTIGFLKEYSDTLENANIPLQEQIKFEFEMLGYINTIYDNIEKNICYVLDIDTKYSPKLTLYSLGTGKEITVKVQKSVYENNIIKKSSIIHINKFEQKYKSIRTENGWEKTSEKEWWIQSYKKLDDLPI